MKYGYCTGFSTEPLFQLGEELLGLISETGFDYVEYPMMNFASMEEDDFCSLVKKTRSNGLSSPVACNFFPGSVRLVGKEANEDQIRHYLDIVLDRCDALGIKTIILGSGPARTYTDEQTHDEAFEQFRAIISSVILPKTEEHGIKVLIEPFETKSCNLITSILEGLELVKKVASPSFSLMVDLYHMNSNNEPLSSIDECFQYIEHVHIAGRDRRVMTEDDTYVFDALRRLKQLGYDGCVSFETLKPENNKQLISVLKKVKAI